ncbi:hypothetical protein [Actinomadura formosensis]|uniref:hypothetical protein n=1 Tax=Actinomadura formosensis TaxID=60706 RepID=UPI000A8613E7|nr:hypothetical protein [Actinomadura formosensis]
MPFSAPPCSQPGTTRFRGLLALATLVVAFLCVLAPGARADAPSLHATPSHPTNREPVTISGRFQGAASGLDVLLQREGGMFGGEWEPAASATTRKGGSFAFHLDRVDGDETYRAVLSGDGRRRLSKEFKLGVRYESVDRRWVRGDATGNRRTFFTCFDSTGDQCASNDDAHTSPTWLAAVLVLCFLGGAALLVWGAAALPKKVRVAAAVIGLVAWVPLFADLAFGYAIPRVGMEHNAILVTFLYPLYLLVLLLGIALMIGYPFLMTRLMRADVMPHGRPGRAGLFGAVLAVLVIWGEIYKHAPAVAAGPFAVKTHWLNDAVHTWSLQWPVSVLWTVLEFFATQAGLVSFGALALVSVLLPAPRGMPGTSALTLAHGTAANVSAFIVGSAAVAVISIVVFAVLVLAAVALMAYVMFYILVAFTTAAMLAYLLKR